MMSWSLISGMVWASWETSTLLLPQCIGGLIIIACIYLFIRYNQSDKSGQQQKSGAPAAAPKKLA
ncbi:hypothetical protein [Brevibacillus sp. SIMBA_040]|uniref:hypothetical protein n=1 Tax=unclassified Brevibacillus TaxID=2684853 RepID=UPI00397D40E1